MLRWIKGLFKLKSGHLNEVDTDTTQKVKELLSYTSLWEKTEGGLVCREVGLHFMHVEHTHYDYYYKEVSSNLTDDITYILQSDISCLAKRLEVSRNSEKVEKFLSGIDKCLSTHKRFQEVL
jgi:hypothetical protein